MDLYLARSEISILTGIRWVTLTKLPDELSGGNRDVFAPVDSEIEMIFPFIFPSEMHQWLILPPFQRVNAEPVFL